jgi:hypothetical protein
MTILAKKGRNYQFNSLNVIFEGVHDFLYRETALKMTLELLEELITEAQRALNKS